jgi:hypothetical protein
VSLIVDRRNIDFVLYELKHRHRDRGTQSGLQLRERGDLRAFKQPLQGVGVKAGWAHNVIIQPMQGYPRLIHNIMEGACKEPGSMLSAYFTGSPEDADRSSRRSAAP